MDCALKVLSTGRRATFLPVEQRAACGSVGNALYALLGCIFLGCSPSEEGLTQKSQHLQQQTGFMMTWRASHADTLLPDGRVLVSGGFAASSDQPHTSAELYNPQTGSWAFTGSMSQPRREHRSILLPSGKVLVSGGFGNLQVPTTSAEVYDFSTGAWTPILAMSVPRAGHTMTLLPTGMILVTGGVRNNQGNATNTAELFDPSTNAWTVTGNMGSTRVYHSATLLPSGKVLIAGGRTYWDGFPLTNAELFDPATGNWTPTGQLNEGHVSCRAVLLSTGKVLLAGGFPTPQSWITRSELYDPATGTWTLAGQLLAGVRHHFTMTLLPSGHPLILGGTIGTNGFGTQIPQIEVFEPSTSAWNTSESLSYTRYEHTATLLQTGSVLIAGGVHNNAVTTRADLFVSGLPPSSPCALDGECLLGYCVDGFCCNSRCGGACETCAQNIGASTDGECGLRPALSVCRGAATECDALELCDGLTTACPPDMAAPDGAACDAGTCSVGLCVAPLEPDAGTDAGLDFPDAGALDGGPSTNDGGYADAGVADAGDFDAGIDDAGSPDSGLPDAGLPDAGAPDAGATVDAGTVPGYEDAGIPEDGGGGTSPDAGSTAPAEAGPGGNETSASGCGCTAADGSAQIALTAWAFLLWLRCVRRFGGGLGLP